MKKIFLLSVGVVVSTMLGMGIGAAASSGADIVEKLFDEANVQDNYKNDQRELEKLADSGDGIPFENLYLFVYKNVKEGPQEAALKEVASRTDYSKSELESIVLNGETQPIIDKNNQRIANSADAAYQAARDQEEAEFEQMLVEQDYTEEEKELARNEFEHKIANEEPYTTEMTQAYMLNEYSSLKSAYDAELAFQQDNKKLAYQALANEMFMNGETDDSAGIDLMYDLNLINTVLFIKDLNLKDRDGDGEVDLASEEDGSGGSDNGDDGSGDLVVVLSSEEDEAVNNFTCWEDEDLRDALDEYEQNPPTGTGTADSGDVTDSGDVYAYNVEDVQDEEELETLQDFNDLLDSFDAPAGNWKFELPCNDVFCIVVNLVSEGEAASADDEYEETDNCIACHIKFIKERMEQTLSKSLVPSKVSMNWFEDAVCKAAGKYVDVDLNIYTIPKPIVLDPDNEMSEESQKQVDKLTQDLEAYNHSRSDKTQSDVDCEAILNQYRLAGGMTTNDEALQNCTEAADARQAQLDDVVGEFIFQSQKSSSDAMYEQIAGHLNVLYYYFESFETALQNTTEPLSELVSKQYCQ